MCKYKRFGSCLLIMCLIFSVCMIPVYATQHNDGTLEISGEYNYSEKILTITFVMGGDLLTCEGDAQCIVIPTILLDGKSLGIPVDMTCDFFNISNSSPWKDNLFFEGTEDGEWPDQFSFSGMNAQHFTATASYSIELNGNEKISIDKDNTFWLCWYGKNEAAGDDADDCTEKLSVVCKDINFTSLDSVTYIASLKNPSVTEIVAGGTFTADVYASASNGVLSGCQLSFDCVGGTIQSIEPAEGLTYAEGSNGKFSFYGNTKDAANGLKVATVTVKAADDTSGPVVLFIRDDAMAAVSGDTADKPMTLSDENKSVTVAIKAPFEYVPYAAGKDLVKYTGSVASGKAVKYLTEDMYYSDKYQAWVCLVDSTVSESIKASDFSVVDGTVQSIKYEGDVNLNGSVNIVDAQIAYDIGNSVYNSFDKLTMPMWLSADINTEVGINALDARAIQCIIHGITE